MDLRESGYMHIHLWLNIWITLAEDLSMYSVLPFSTSSSSKQESLKILNHTIYGSRIFMQARITPFLMIEPPWLCCIIDLEYVHISPICTKFHGFITGMLLGESCPQRVSLFFNCWLLFHTLMDSYDLVKSRFR